jgi:phosphoglycerate dehydrogenase-like enzyme
MDIVVLADLYKKHHFRSLEQHFAGRYLCEEKQNPNAVLAHKPALTICFDEHYCELANAIGSVKEQGVGTLQVMDWILEWRRTWEYRREGHAIDGVVLPLNQPSLSQRIACHGRRDARIMESWGNLGKCEIVGAPRMDRLVDRRPSGRTPQLPPSGRKLRILVMTAKTPGFTREEVLITVAALKHLKAHFNQRSDVDVVWRLTSDMDLAFATIDLPSSLSVARKAAGVGVDDVWSIHARAEQGAALLLFDIAAGRRTERFEWTGPGFDVLLELPQRGEWAQQGSPVEEWVASDMTGSTSNSLNYGYLNEYPAFLNAIAGNAERPSNDFHFALTFMRLVGAILECRSGDVNKITPVIATHPAKDIVSRRRMIVRKNRPDRPIVSILQSPATQPKFFSIGQLTHLGKISDIRLNTSGTALEPGIEDADVIILGWDAPELSREDLASAKCLKLGVVLGASVRPAHPNDFLARGILLCNTAESIAQSVAEHCLMLTLAGLRKLTTVDREMHEGGWPPLVRQKMSVQSVIKTAKKLPGAQLARPLAVPLLRQLRARGPKTRGVNGVSQWNDLRGQIVGIIGWGNVVQQFAFLLRPLYGTLLVNSSVASEASLRQFNARTASIGEILSSSKVISSSSAVCFRRVGQRALTIVENWINGRTIPALDAGCIVRMT